MQTWVGAETYAMLGSTPQLEPEEGLRTRRAFLPWCYSGAGVCTWLVSSQRDLVSGRTSDVLLKASLPPQYLRT